MQLSLSPSLETRLGRPCRYKTQAICLHTGALRCSSHVLTCSKRAQLQQRNTQHAARRHDVGAIQPSLCRAQSMDAEVTADQGDMESNPMSEAAERMQAFLDALPELSMDLVTAFVDSCPSATSMPPAEVHSKLEAAATQLGTTIPKIAKLVAKVPNSWERSADELLQKLQPLAAALGSPTTAMVDLVISQPQIWNINTTSIVKDRLDSLATRLGTTLPAVVDMVAAQPMVWVIPPNQIQNTIKQASGQLGLSYDSTIELIKRMPVLLVLEQRLLMLGVDGLAATSGVPVAQLIELLSRSLGLVALPTEVLGSNLENLSAVLQVDVEAVLDLVIRQPTLLIVQATNIHVTLDMLTDALQISRKEALDVLVRQPALLYDYTPQTIQGRLQALATTFQVSIDDVRALAVQQPALLVIAPSSIKAGLSAFGDAPLQEVLMLLVNDPGAFVMFGFMENMIDQWSVRLGLEPQMVGQLVSNQPALLDISPNTVKARLESLSALFGIPLGIVTQLVLKHPALATIPPNVTITKVKMLSMALGTSMQVAATLVAKEPATLCCAAAPQGEFNRDLKPHVDGISEVIAAYEYYTMEWIQRQLKEAAPQRLRSFSTLDRR